jgi:hypothetical protein
MDGVNLYCDESGGIGRGVMTLAAARISLELADQVVGRFRAVTGIDGEIKGSRISLGERGFLFELLAQTDFAATVSVAISAVRPDPGEDRGSHDMAVYGALLNDAVGSMLPVGGDCTTVTMDDGRYSPEILSHIRDDIGAMIGPCGTASLALSHRLSGLQIADVIANTFFTRALTGDRQIHMDALVAPFLSRKQIAMRILPDS